MIFNSFYFLWVFPLIFCFYYLINSWNKVVGKNPRINNYVLIFISYFLYLKWNPVYVFVLLWVTAITYVFALIIENKAAYGKKKYIISFGLIFSVLPLFIFKYYNFISDNIEDCLSYCGFHVGLPGLNIIMPLGLSFYTMIAIGYLFDVYYQRYKAEHNWWDYMLFVCFFPQIASGPISKAKDLLPKIKNRRIFNRDQATQGLKWILWGMFLKVVVADRLGIYVNTVYDNYVYQSGSSCLLASILYTFQIYSDFAGYSFMAVGVGELMGFELVNNFRRPYLSVSVTDFWHRWHISLSLWLKDYIYIPLGGNRCSKARNYWNILVTFLVSGLWHGANWTFIVWGGLHGMVQIIEKFFYIQKCNHNWIVKIFRISITFMIINFLWIIFRMDNLTDAFEVIKKIFTDRDMSLQSVPPSTVLYMVLGLFVLLVKDLMDEYVPVKYTFFHHGNAIVRWASYFVILYVILACGVFNASQFIYVSF